MNHPQAEASQAPAAFPLTELQHAYWLGEQPAYRLHTPAYLHRCFRAPALDIERLETAISAVVQAQPSLVVEIREDGTQQPQCPPERVTLRVNDFGHVTASEAAAYLKAREATLAHELPPLGRGLQFSWVIDRVADGYFVHVLFRLIAFDAMSIWLFLSDVCGVYLGIRPPPLPAAQFAEFVGQRQALMHSAGYQQSLAYWRERAATLPPAPGLPLVDHEALPERSDFQRLQLSLSPRQSDELHAQARRCGVGINVLLCTLYADVLRLWSTNSSFVLNMLTSHRPPGEHFAHVYGNFGSTLPVEAVDVPGGGLRERARALQRRMFRDLKHVKVCGVEVIRAMRRGAQHLPAMPVVFASSLGLSRDDLLTPAQLGWELQLGGLRTPQVLLDCQVYMDGDRLTLNWDYVAAAFLPGVIEDMFAALGERLMALVAGGTEPDALQLPHAPPEGLAARRAANATDKLLPTGRLYDFFTQAHRSHPDRPALIDEDRTLSYAELWCLTTRLATRLRGLAGRNELVAIVARRGWRQVAAAMAVVQSGAAYLPVSSDAPAARKSWLVSQPGVKVILVEHDLAGGFERPASAETLLLESALSDGHAAATEPFPLRDARDLQDLAYVMFTSGSTGRPKGVMIDHRGAVNTLQDVTSRFGLNASDRVIGISAFTFDLSVFDIFGSLGSGATLVLPPDSPSPAPHDWARVVREHQVTVWNSVPALLDMVLEYLGPHASRELASLRLVMLSGDWIPLRLAQRVAEQLPQARLVSLGGATEASIWSNYFVVDHVDPHWTSIPYGWPLANQRFHVLTPDLRDAPTWVPGELYIGGTGLAHGYHGDPERTAERFITHPSTGERLYRTGDMGRYHASGCIEFLGRNDDQVKIRGYRIELGEIDAALDRCPGVRLGATIVRQGDAQERQLVALYVRDNDHRGEVGIREHLARTLPGYMVPVQYIELQQLPVTANGKIDRKALAETVAALPAVGAGKRAPGTAMEQRLAAVWQQLLHLDQLGVDDDFFELGGTSLLAVRLLNAITAEFGQRLPLASLLHHSTLAAQAAQIARAAQGEASCGKGPLVMLRQGTDSLLVAVHPAGGNVLCYRELATLVPRGMAVLALQSAGDGSPREVSDMATRYIEAMSAHLSARPFHLLGWSMGGILAQEMARQLEVRGALPASLVMVDSWQSADPRTACPLTGYALLHNFVRDQLGGRAMPKTFAAIEKLPPGRQAEAALAALAECVSDGTHLSTSAFTAMLAEYKANYEALTRHVPRAIRTPTCLFRALRSGDFPMLAPFTAPSGGPPLNVIGMDEDHFSIVQGSALRAIVARLPDEGNARHTPGSR